MCAALLVVSSAFIRALSNLREQDAGYQDARQLVVAAVRFPGSYRENSRDELIDALRRRAMSLPGVRGVAFSHVGQLSGGAIEMRIGLSGRDPIGARFFRDGGTHSRKPMEVVGVVRDSKWLNMRDESPARYYRPYKQMGGTPVVTIAVRTSGSTDAAARDLLLLAKEIDNGMTLSDADLLTPPGDGVVLAHRSDAYIA